MKTINKYFMMIITILLASLFITGCSNEYHRKPINDETRDHINEIVSGTYNSAQPITFKNKNELQAKEINFIITPKGEIKSSFETENFDYKLVIKTENEDIELQLTELKKDAGIDSYKFSFNLLETNFKFNMAICKEKIVLYTENHLDSSSAEYGIFYNDIAIVLNRKS